MPSFRRQLALAFLSTGTLIVLAVSPHLLGGRVADAVDGLGDAEPTRLWLAALLFVSMHASSGLAWGVASRACGTTIDNVDAIARYGVGSGLNAIAPFRLGSAVRVALFARVPRPTARCGRPAERPPPLVLSAPSGLRRSSVSPPPPASFPHGRSC